MKPTRTLFPATLLALLALPAVAADVAFSGFGTLGYAVSDRPYKYQRDIDDDGTVMRDSHLGVQMDVQFTPQWRGTIQALLAPADNHDNRWEAQLSWAFLSWRPDNDWLLRAGKLRVPGYLNSENMEVGTTFDYARLPIEMYSMSPTYDFLGVSFNKIWELDAGELGLDGFWGRRDTYYRYSTRQDLPGFIQSGPGYLPLDIELRGLVLTWRKAEDVYRIGLHDADVHRTDGMAWTVRPLWTDLGGGYGYYNIFPGPALPTKDSINLAFLTLGADVGLGHDVRLAAEYAVRQVKGIDFGLESTSGYLSLRRRMGAWTPYVYYAWLRSKQDRLDLFQAMNGTSIPDGLLDPSTTALINASQTVGADFLNAVDQHTWALGASYALSPTSKLKLEWQRTRIGVTSHLVDSPPGGNIRNQDINVFSLSYNFVF